MIVVAIVFLVGTSLLQAGTIAGADSESPNNNDYKGAFEDNPNAFKYNPGKRPRLATLEVVVAVVDSAGMTEYAVSLAGAILLREEDEDDFYELQLGFGRGANFVAASNLVPELSFDAPDPDPAPTTIVVPGFAGFPDFAPFFNLVRESSDLLVWQWNSENCTGNFCLEPDLSSSKFFFVSVDVPDLPESVMDAYLPGDLPEGFPPGAKAFTIRGRFVEPSEEPAPSFLRGDCNGDGAVNVSDAVCGLNWLFAGATEPGCVAAVNTNGDDAVNLADSVSTLNFLFAGGPEPLDPFPDCGPGTSLADEALGCTNPRNCQ